jgi:TPR repeat protein
MLLAQCYLHGEGVKEDDRQAFLWYEKAAYHGVTKAQMMTSLFYFNGFGTRKNKLKAKAWLDTAMQDEAFVENVRGKKDTMQKLLRVRKKTRFTDCL